MGSVRALINRAKLSNGNADVVYYVDYYPFGSTLQSAGIPSRYGYQGEHAEKDDETGWNNFYLRNYHPMIGRRLSTDPYNQYYSPYVGMAVVSRVRIISTQQPGLSATRYCPTSQSYRMAMYNYNQLLANINYNDLSNPTTSLAIGKNVAEHVGVAYVAYKSYLAVKSLRTLIYGSEAAEGSTTVYTSVSKGVTQYVGITDNLAGSSTEHLASKGITYSL